MLIEIRTYTCKVGTVGLFLQHYEKEGLPLQALHLGEPIGFFVSEIGGLNEVVHLWGFESLADRELRRAALLEDEKWHSFLKSVTSTGYLMSQSSSIYRPTSFSRIR